MRSWFPEATGTKDGDWEAGINPGTQAGHGHRDNPAAWALELADQMRTAPRHDQPAQTGRSEFLEEAKTGRPITIPKGVPESAPGAAEKAQATVADIALASPDLRLASGAAATLSAAHACDRTTHLPLTDLTGCLARKCRTGPAGYELPALEGRLFFDWAVAGLDPN